MQGATYDTEQDVALFFDYLSQGGEEHKYYCHQAHTDGTVHTNNTDRHIHAVMTKPNGETIHHDQTV